MSGVGMGEIRKLGLGDIADLREYERSRPELQARVFEVKRHRRVSLGPIMSVVFENALTIRYQIQEMARVEKMTTDAQIEEELRVYNPLIPDPGELSATLFLELTDEAQLREWLPKLVGVEHSVLLELGDSERTCVRCIPDEGHAAQLTREEVTASVHYIRFALSPAETIRFEAGPVFLASDHPAYQVEVELSAATREELLGDLLA
jgi:Protein of unknown function (DUF3501)